MTIGISLQGNHSAYRIKTVTLLHRAAIRHPGSPKPHRLHANTVIVTPLAVAFVASDTSKCGCGSADDPPLTR